MNLTWRVLNYETSSLKRKGWYTRVEFEEDFLAGGCTQPMPTGYDCDEFPYLSTTQGGFPAEPTPSLRLMRSGPNQDQGRLIRIRLYEACEMRPAVGTTKTTNGSGGDRFLVLPIPNGPVTTGMCNWKKTNPSRFSGASEPSS